jgi:hypothetical protein
VIVFRREKRGGLLVLILAPMAFAMLAALVKSYPYTGARTMVYCLPGLTLLIAAGLGPLIQWLRTRLPAVASGILIFLLLFPFAETFAFSLYTAAVPWKRADTFGASSYVLAHLQPGDLITTNHWEYEYYFRKLGPVLNTDFDAVSRMADSAKPHRLWLVLNAGTTDARFQIEKELLDRGWHMEEDHEFQNASVFLLSRNAQN